MCAYVLSIFQKFSYLFFLIWYLYITGWHAFFSFFFRFFFNSTAIPNFMTLATFIVPSLARVLLLFPSSSFPTLFCFSSITINACSSWAKRFLQIWPVENVTLTNRLIFMFLPCHFKGTCKWTDLRMLLFQLSRCSFFFFFFFLFFFFELNRSIND